jgi:hypothetical protein
VKKCSPFPADATDYSSKYQETEDALRVSAALSQWNEIRQPRTSSKARVSRRARKAILDKVLDDHGSRNQSFCGCLSDIS